MQPQNLGNDRQVEVLILFVAEFLSRLLQDRFCLGQGFESVAFYIEFQPEF